VGLAAIVADPERTECLTCPDGHSGPVRPCLRCGLLPPLPHRVWARGASAMMLDGEWAVLIVQVSYLKRAGHVSLCPTCLAATVAVNVATRGGTIPAGYQLRRPQAGPDAARPHNPPDDDDDDDDDDAPI
jgi:hypothetical protein